MEIKWSKVAVDQLSQLLDFIIETGFTAYAIQLEDNIFAKIENLVINYTIYPIDKYKKTMTEVISLLK